MVSKRWRMAAVAAVLCGAVAVPFVRNALADSGTNGGNAHAGAVPGVRANAMTAASLPPGYTVQGIDVYSGSHSTANPTIDWTAVAASGVQFAYIKATEGSSYVNPYFVGDATHEADYASARNAGLYVGAYAYGRPDNADAKGQADFLVANSGWAPDDKTLVPMLDIEAPYFTTVNSCYNLTPAAMATWIRTYVDEVKARIGRLPLIYTGANWWNTCVDPSVSFADVHLDLAYWNSTPPTPPTGFTTFDIWQYAAGNTSQVGNYDKNVINGDINVLKALAGATAPLVVTLHAHANGEFVTADSAGAKPLIANRWSIGTWEQFDVIPLDTGNVALRSHGNGHFVTAENGGALPLIANRMAIGGWEQFQKISNSDGSYSFKALANGKYVTAESAGASALIANRTGIGGWEEFDLVVNRSTIHLRAHANGKYVTADPGAGGQLIANRTAIGSWETFEEFDLNGTPVFGLRALSNNRIVTSNGGGSPLAASRTAIGGWESWTIVHNPDGSVSLKSSNGKYVCAESAGAKPLIANRTAIGLWESFDLIEG
jgi:GH25 family lysozyme M1 (1,4-beta-N-acetylmuramidase)